MTVNNQPTTISITSPAANATVSGSVTVTATATAATGLTIASVQFKVDGALLTGTVTNSGNSYSIVMDTPKLTNASHAITAVATDSANNVVTSAGVSVTVNNQMTAVSITSPAANATVAGSVTVSANATAATGLTITSVVFKVDGVLLTGTVTNFGNSYSIPLDTTKLTNASPLITAHATDSANNVVTSPGVSVTVNNQATSISITMDGTTNTQAILTYTAPSASPCTIEVSEHPSFTPLVHDVNPALFPGANLDGGGDAARSFVVGKMTVATALDGTNRSRALQADTLHYYRRTCDGAATAGTFKTKTIPAGLTHVPNMPVTGTTGDWLQPTLSMTDRSQEVIDPITGALMKRVMMPLDDPYEWSAHPASNITTRGAMMVATIDTLGMAVPANDDLSFDFVRIAFHGAISTNSVLNLCWSRDADGSTCLGPAESITATSAGEAYYNESSALGKMLGIKDPLVSSLRGTTLYLIAWYPGLLVGPPIINDIQVTWGQSHRGVASAAGFHDICGIIDPQGWTKCIVSKSLYAIHSVTGEVRFMGSFYNPTYRTGCDTFGIGSFMWSSVNPNWIYCGTLRLQLDASNTAKSTGAMDNYSTFTGALDLLPNGWTYTLDVLLHQFDPTLPTGWGCTWDTKQMDYLIGSCRSYQQDSYAYLFAFSVGDGTAMNDPACGSVVAGRCSNSHVGIAAVNPIYARNISRGGTLHAVHSQGDTPIVGFELKGANSSAPRGSGVYTTALAAPVSPYSTEIVVIAEPASPQFPTTLNTLAVGDDLSVENEEMRIVAKVAPLRYTVNRGCSGRLFQAPCSGTGQAHNAGASVTPHFSAVSTTNNAALMFYWNFILDPHALDTNFSDQSNSGNHAYAAIGDPFGVNGAHQASRGNARVMCAYEITSVQGGVENGSSLGKPSTYPIPAGQLFAGKGAFDFGNSYQCHPAVESHGAWVTDNRPFVGGDAYGASGGVYGDRSTLVEGNLYKFGGTSYNMSTDRKYLPTLVACGRHTTLDISGPNSYIQSSATDYTFCWPEKGGECRPDSQAGRPYINCPMTNMPYCLAGEIYSGGNDICVGNQAYEGNATTQFGVVTSLDENTVIREGPKRARVLGKAFQRLRYGSSNAKVIPGGNWILHPGFSAETGAELLLLKNPAFAEPDGIDRQNFVNVPVQVAALAGADNVYVEFGYDGNFQCTSRRESCVSATSNNPYFFGSEAFNGVSCSSGCNVEIPAISSRVLYYRIVYRKADVVISRSKTVNIAVP